MPPPDLRPMTPRRLARTGKMLTATVAVLAAVAAGLMLNSRNDRAEAAVVWNEEFNGAAGAGVDTSHWNFDTGGGGFGNNELEYYTSGTSNVAQDGQGHLVITARRESGGHSCWYGTCQWTSGRIQTAGKFTQLYGHIEARMQIPEGNGLWPAFWMLGGSNWPTDGEIDIMENVGRTPNTVYGTIHGPGYSGGNAVGGTRTLSAPLGNAFHNYAVDWSPNLIVWTIDGSEYFRATPASTRGNPWVYSHPFFIILNLAVGGSFPGSPDGSTPSSNRLVVDYIHVNTTLGGGGSTTPPTTGPTTTPPTSPTTPPAGSTTWAPGVAYHVGDVVTYNGVSYRCLQAHTSIVTWEPPNTPALWQRL